MRKRIQAAVLAAALCSSGFCTLPLGTTAADTVYEFENGTIYDAGDNVTAVVDRDGASGGRAVSLLDAGDAVTLQIAAATAGNYTLTIRYAQPFDEAGKYQNVVVNGEQIGQVLCTYTGDSGFATADISANLKEGNNTVTIEASWGWSYLDTLTLSEGKSFGNVGSGILSNPNASAQAQSLYSFLCDTYGNYVISGQQESTWMGSVDYEMHIIQNASGKLPVLRGLDYMGDDFGGVNQRAKDWYAKGGIVEICWHCGSDFSGSHTESLETNLNWDAALTPGTNEYNALIAGMDKAAKALQELEDAGVPVLWRPFHEFDGQWFWWGKGGADNFKKLWQIMYNRYTNDWGLDNLIWVLGYSGETKDGWYPGDAYVDIVGADTYVNHTNSLLSMYQKTASIANKPVCLHENGPIPDPDKMASDGANWLWFMTWHTSFVDNHDINTTAYLNKVYNSDHVLTLDEIPDIYHYTSEPASLQGDVDLNGTVQVADIVLLQKYLLHRETLTQQQFDNADMTGEGTVNGFDLAILKRTLLAAPAAPALTPSAYMQSVKSAVSERLPAGLDTVKSGVDYGSMQTYSYYSTTRERQTNVNVLLPAGYNEQETYPVLYMLHGYWDNEDTLASPEMGLQTILGNLTAAGEAKKMIVVFPYIYTSKTMPYCTAMDLENSLNYDNFIHDLTTDLIPFIESTFSVAKGREHRAISGFSMGGRESLFIGITRSDLFGYVGAVAPAPGLTPGWDPSMHPGQLSESELVFDKAKGEPWLVLLSGAVNDYVVGTQPEQYHNMFNTNGVEHLWNSLPDGGHDGSSIRPHFANFTRCIFKAD